MAIEPFSGYYKTGRIKGERDLLNVQVLTGS